jgi:hypothetical protein
MEQPAAMQRYEKQDKPLKLLFLTIIKRHSLKYTNLSHPYLLAGTTLTGKQGKVMNYNMLSLSSPTRIRTLTEASGRVV